jgi:hypothetical protein
MKRKTSQGRKSIGPPTKEQWSNFIRWVSAFSGFVALVWRGAELLASLVQGTCAVCERPSSFLWMPRGDHALCERLQGDVPRGTEREDK